MLAALTVAGAAYLVWLGVCALRRPPAPVAADGARGSWPAQVARGAGISGLNPKALLLFLALLPQFTTPAGWAPGVQIAVLGLLHTISCAVVYTGVGAGARTVLGTRPRAARVVGRVSGAAMIVIGLVLLVEQVVAAGG